MLKNLGQFQCHKVVGAGKIIEVTKHVDGGDLLAYRDAHQGEAWVKLPTGWAARFKADVGGYLVQYDDGYLSYSPPEPFEAGYTRIEI